MDKRDSKNIQWFHTAVSLHTALLLDNSLQENFIQNTAKLKVVQHKIIHILWNWCLSIFIIHINNILYTKHEAVWSSPLLCGVAEEFSFTASF